MAILPGRRLGPYEILSAIGAGGMGEVYRARDTRLDRIVAIKVLPTHLADRSELRERFEREARTIASLNHPHICTLYDIGHQDGIDYLVMEYLEGETLAQRLQKGPLPLDQVLQYAIEIADALDKAHRKGVTHRDLKPGNIMLTKSGTKLLDFGLAKLHQERHSCHVHFPNFPPQRTHHGAGDASWAHCSTWPRSSWKARKPMPARTFLHLAWWSTRWRRARGRLRARVRRA